MSNQRNFDRIYAPRREERQLYLRPKRKESLAQQLDSIQCRLTTITNEWRRLPEHGVGAIRQELRTEWRSLQRQEQRIAHKLIAEEQRLGIRKESSQ